MAQAFNGIASDLEHLSERVRDLEQRISALESPPMTVTHACPRSETIARRQSSPLEPGQVFPAPNLPAGALPVFGRALLGIAGAYLLRAAAESGIIPQLPVLIAAIVYAGVWLAWAFRTHATNRFASVTYAVTAAVILSPLLWESTVRFHFLWPGFTASVLVAFVGFALVMAWRQNLQTIPWVATLAAVATTVALIVATRDLVPFTAGLLAIALATEAVVCSGHRLSVRAVPAIAADFAVWLLVYLMTFPGGVPPEYRPAAPPTITAMCLALLIIYTASIGLPSFRLRHRLTIFEIAQGIVAFLLATFGMLRAYPSSSPALGIIFLLLAMVCYWGALSRFAADDQSRNRRVCATYAVALVLAASLLLFPARFQVPFLCLAAVTAASLYRRTSKLSVGMHVSFYLAAAAILSGLLTLVGNAVAGNMPQGLNAGAWVVAVSSALSYAIGSPVLTDQWKQRLLWIIPCVLVTGVGAALALIMSVRLVSASWMLNTSGLSVVRTVVTCSIALTLGFSGSHLERAEQLWVAYVAIAFGTLKLLFEDLRFGNPASLVASLMFYGLILILIPRLTRHGRNRC
jgi:hypothetical protein